MLSLYCRTLLALCIAVSSTHGQRNVLCIGDSITAGFPHNDNHSYHTELSSYLPTTPNYIGNPSDTVSGNRGADGMASNAMQYIVGGDGRTISDLNMFNRDGARESFNDIKDTLATPDEVVILIGVNDLISLIASSTTTDRFVPGTVQNDFNPGGGVLPAGSDDYTDGGVYVENVTYDSATDTYHYPALDPTTRPVIDPIIDRFEDLVSDVRAAFPSTHIILVTVPVPDAAGAFSDSEFQAARVVLKPTVKLFNSQIAALASTLGSRYSCISPRMIEPVNTTDPGGPTYVASPDLQSGDGLHPSQNGYDKVGDAIASVILYRIWAESQFPADFGDDAKEASLWGIDADPDHDGWSNGIEHYLAMDPNAFDLPTITNTVSGNDFTYIYHMNENVVLRSMDVEYSTDLSVWTPDDLTPRSAASPSGGVIEVTTTLTVSPWERVFFRLCRPAHP